MFYTYVLKSEIGNRLYVGSTEDLPQRLADHNRGKTKSTKGFRPWKLVYYEGHLTKHGARAAELFYKTGQGRRQLKKKLEFNEEIKPLDLEVS